MASSLAEKINQNFLQCGICLEPFRNPRGLPCLHSFCEECLERWVKTNKEKNPKVLICPNCKKSTPLPPDGIKGLPAHFLVKSLQETISMEKANEDYSKKICGHCNKPDRKAAVYCSDCQHVLCESCLDVHKAWEAMKHHRVVTVEDLSSGKVTLSDTQDQYCKEHDEKKKFYCKMCGKPVCRDCIVMKQHCRDHEYVTLKDYAAEKSRHIQEEMKKCDEKMKECQDSIKKAERVTSKLISTAEYVKATCGKVKADYMQQMEQFFLAKESAIHNVKETRVHNLGEIKNTLEVKMVELEDASKEGNALIGAGSHHDIIANHTHVLYTLHKVNQIQLDEVDQNLADIQIPKLTCVLDQQWKQTEQFEVPADDNEGPRGIAVISDGSIALCEYWRRVHVFSRLGVHKNTFPIEQVLGGDGNVSVTPDDMFVIPLFSLFPVKNHCEIFNHQFKLHSEFKTYDAKKSPCEPYAVAVDKNGCIILGMKNNAIAIHNADGSLKFCFATTCTPRSVTVTSHDEIVVVSNNGTLQLLDYSGKSIQTLDPPPEVKRWIPRYVCCSKRDEVFVVNEGDPKGIYKYAAGRVYMGCVTTEVSDPWGIALTHDDQELFVTEYSDKLVKIFKRP